MSEPRLHWSLDHGHGHGEGIGFFGELIEALRAPDKGLAFAVLPNFSSGYGGVNRQRFGDLHIEQSENNDGYDYAVRYRNEVSGESLDLRYRTATAAHRPLRGTWSLATTNDAGFSYRGLRSVGRLIDGDGGKRLQLTVDGRLTVTGRLLPPECEPTINWSLFDCLGELASKGCSLIDLIEDGEKPRLGGRLVAMERWAIEIDDTRLPMRGLCLHGPGQVPSHWWLADDGRVLLMSTTFKTFVRIGGAC